MKYIIIGLLLSIGWHVVKLVYGILEELIFCRLHDARWYLIMVGKETKRVDTNDGVHINTVKNQIGFNYTKDEL